MSLLKLIVLGIGWVLASLTIAVVVAILATELLLLFGIVDSGASSYSVAINGTAVVVFVAVVSIPVVFRRRFTDPERPVSLDGESGEASG